MSFVHYFMCPGCKKQRRVEGEGAMCSTRTQDFACDVFARVEGNVVVNSRTVFDTTRQEFVRINVRERAASTIERLM